MHDDTHTFIRSDMGIFGDDFLQNLLRQQRLLEQQRSLLGPSASLEMMKAMLEGWERERRMMLRPLAGLLEAQREYRDASQRLIGASSVSHLSGIVEALQAARSGLIAKDVTHEFNHWQTLRDQLLAAPQRPQIDRLFQASAFEWQDQLGRLTTALDTALLSNPGWTPPTVLTETFAAPALAYSEFSRQTIAMLPGASTRDTSALEASLALADQQVSATTSLAVGLIKNSSASSGSSDTRVGDHSAAGAPPPPAEDEGQPTAPDGAGVDTGATSITLFRAQQGELVTAGISADADYDAVLGVSPSARVTNLARRLVGTLLEIDGARSLAGEPDVFSRTLAVVKAISTLSWLRVNDETTLGTAVDALYILVYEGSGYMKRVEAILPDPLCEPVWKLKHLRNKWLRHDPQHGKASDQRKNIAELREALAYFGSSRKPLAPVEYAALYEGLLAQMTEFAETLLVAVVTTAPG